MRCSFTYFHISIQLGLYPLYCFSISTYPFNCDILLYLSTNSISCTVVSLPISVLLNITQPMPLSVICCSRYLFSHQLGIHLYNCFYISLPISVCTPWLLSLTYSDTISTTTSYRSQMFRKTSKFSSLCCKTLGRKKRRRWKCQNPTHSKSSERCRIPSAKSSWKSKLKTRLDTSQFFTSPAKMFSLKIIHFLLWPSSLIQPQSLPV